MSGIPGIKTVIIGNDREFFSPVDRFVPHHLREEYYESDLDEADMDIMWEGDNKIAIMPRPLDPAYVADISMMFNYANFHILTPRETSAGLCSDILSDQRVLSTLVETMRLNQYIRLIPFGNTLQFYRLLSSLRGLGLHFITPETPPEEAFWTVQYLDTKVGSRELLIRASHINPNVKIPEGFLVHDIATGLNIANFFIATGRGVVFKANQGGSGIGVNVFSPASLKDPAGISTMQHEVSKSSLYNSGEPFIVEEYIQPDFEHQAVFPSVDARVFADGTIWIEAIDAMVIRHTRSEVGFYGCVVGKGLFSEAEAEKLRSFTMTVGELLRSFGYIGWFDVDYIVSPNGKMTATEVNLRSTSMRYMIEIGRRILGDEYSNVAALRSNDKYIRKNLHGISYHSLKTALSGLLYPIEGENRGIVISECVRSKYGRGKFGYCIIGRDQDDTKHIEIRMEAYLEQV